MFPAEIRASWAFVERNFYLLRRYLAWEIVFLVYSLVNTLTIALIGMASGDPRQVMFLVVGAVLWGFLSLLFHEVAESVSYERWEGTLEYTFMAPVRRTTYLMGNSLFAALYGVVRTLVILVVVSLFLRISLPGANLGTAALVLAVSSVAFVGLGLCAAVLPLLSPEKGSQATHIVQAVLLLVSGVYYDVSVLPAWLQPAAALSPATYTLKAMRLALLEGAGVREVLPYLGILCLLGILLVPLGVGIFQAAEAYARRTGLLARNG